MSLFSAIAAEANLDRMYKAIAKAKRDVLKLTKTAREKELVLQALKVVKDYCDANIGE